MGYTSREQVGKDRHRREANAHMSRHNAKLMAVGLDKDAVSWAHGDGSFDDVVSRLISKVWALGSSYLRPASDVNAALPLGSSQVIGDVVVGATPYRRSSKLAS
jgi:hypothetical protein